jgi:predicted flap endonuclease-1-like 5' DNA nuclease
MALIMGIALVVLGLVVGFILTWALAASQMNLFVGLLLAVAGAIIGFVVEWLIDEAYRKNRELAQRLQEQGEGPVLALAPESLGRNNGDEAAAHTLTEFLRQRDGELRELREQLTENMLRMDAIKAEFEAYQRIHPDNLTVIKGIGPIYQWKLRDLGINTFQQLAQADPEQLQRRLDVKKWQRVNIESWIAQARDWVHETRHEAERQPA